MHHRLQHTGHLSTTLSSYALPAIASSISQAHLQAVTPTQPAPESLLAATELTSPLKTLMAILGNDSPSHASLPSSATIRHMLQHTVQLCTLAFARSPTAISTTIKPLTHLALASKTPFPPAASIWVPTGHTTGLSHNFTGSPDFCCYCCCRCPLSV